MKRDEYVQSLDLIGEPSESLRNFQATERDSEKRRKHDDRNSRFRSDALRIRDQIHKFEMWFIQNLQEERTK